MVSKSSLYNLKDIHVHDNFTLFDPMNISVI